MEITRIGVQVCVILETLLKSLNRSCEVALQTEAVHSTLTVDYKGYHISYATTSGTGAHWAYTEQLAPMRSNSK